jgi:hypothetical protein
MTITTNEVETRLRAALAASIPQLISDETAQPSRTNDPVAATEEPVLIPLALSDMTASRHGAIRWRLLGAAAAVVMLVGGLAIAQLPQTDPAPAVQPPSPSAPEASPQPTLAAELSTPSLRPDVFAVIPDNYPNAALSSAAWGGQFAESASTPAEALVALVDGDTIANGLRLSVVAELDHAFPGPPQAAQVAGLDVEIYVENGTPALTTVVLPGSPTLAVTGQDPIGFIEDVGGFPIDGARIDSNWNATFVVGELPTGYEVVVPPSQLPVGSATAATRVPDNDGGDGLAIWVDVRNPLIGYAQVGEMQQVDVNGTPGWMIDSGPGSPVMWPASPTTWAMISGATNVGIAVDLARSVTFVDETTWAERYDVEEVTDPIPADQSGTDVVVDTTIVVDQQDLIAPAAVVCVDAGATDQTVRLCMDELGGQNKTIQAAKQVDNSFVMPVDPADPEHQADTNTIADALNLPVLAFDSTYLPITAETSTAATIYLVLGRDNAPYTQ